MLKAEIKGDELSLKTLRKNFDDCILVEDGKYFLILQTSQIDVSNLISFAENRLEYMLHILNLEFKESFSANLGLIENIEDNGKKEILARVTGSTLVMKSSCRVSVSYEDKETGEIITFDPYKSSKDLKTHLKCIDENENIKDALDCYYSEDHDWNTLFNVYEVVREDMRGKNQIVNTGWATSIEIDIFTCTAHNVGGGGKRPRHAISKINPNCRRVLSSHMPMELSTAEVLIKRILSNWIDYRCP